MIFLNFTSTQTVPTFCFRGSRISVVKVLPFAQACCYYNKCLQNGLGCCVQWACSFALLVRTSTALAYQLPAAAGSAVRPVPFSAIASRQTCFGPHGQHCDCFAYINHQGGVCSRCMSQLVHHLLLWSQQQPKSFCTIHIPDELNCVADVLSR